jgi:hypothetical protein
MHWELPRIQEMFPGRREGLGHFGFACENPLERVDS